MHTIMRPHQSWLRPAVTLTAILAYLWRRGRRQRHDRIDLEFARSALKEEGSIGLDEMIRKYG